MCVYRQHCHCVLLYRLTLCHMPSSLSLPSFYSSLSSPSPLAQSLVSQKLMFVGRTDSGKMMALRQLLSGGGGSLAADGSSIGGLLPPILVFVATKERAKVRESAGG